MCNWISAALPSSGSRIVPLTAMSVVIGFDCWQVGAIYFWMKEITPYFLKIHGLYAALDVMNKVCVPNSESSD